MHYRQTSKTTAGLHANSSRSGYTIIELLAALGVISFTLTTVSLALHGLGKVNRQLNEELPAAMSVTRLSLQFREDAHEAESYTSEPQADGRVGLTFKRADDDTVVYGLQPGQVVRTRSADGRRLQREIYQLPQNTSVHATSDGDREGKAAVVKLRIEQRLGKSGESVDSKRIETIEAVVGLRLQTR